MIPLLIIDRQIREVFAGLLFWSGGTILSVVTRYEKQGPRNRAAGLCSGIAGRCGFYRQGWLDSGVFPVSGIFLMKWQPMPLAMSCLPLEG